MPTLANEQLPGFAAALIRLRGETLGRIAEATGIRTANLSVWLRGKEQVISAKRLVGLLHHLGVEGGRLRTDVLHQWQDRGALDDSKLVLGKLLADKQSVWLFQDEQPGLIKTRFLLAGDVLIRLEIEPGGSCHHHACGIGRGTNRLDGISTQQPLGAGGAGRSGCG